VLKQGVVVDLHFPPFPRDEGMSVMVPDRHSGLEHRSQTSWVH